MKRLAYVTLVCILGSACRSPAPPPPQPSSESRALTRIADARRVCMAIDRVFPEPQLAVPVAGRTYYACCEDCRERLGREPALRSAVDPVTKRSVDKASAVLARGADDAVLYFESEASLAHYRARVSPA